MDTNRETRTCIIVLDDGTVIQRVHDSWVAYDFIIHKEDDR